MSWYLHAGDGLEALVQIPNAFDLILTDPLFGSTNMDWDIKPDLKRVLGVLLSAVHSRGTVLVYCDRSMLLELSQLPHFRYELVAPRRRPTGGLNSAWRPLVAHEYVAVFQQAPTRAIYHPQMRQSIPRKVKRQARHGEHWGDVQEQKAYVNESGLVNPVSILPEAYIPTAERGRHPFQKALNQLEYLVCQYSDPDGLVGDPFAGSGAHLVAALNQGRSAWGAERIAEYHSGAKAWLEQLYPDKQQGIPKYALGVGNTSEVSGDGL